VYKILSSSSLITTSILVLRSFWFTEAIYLALVYKTLPTFANINTAITVSSQSLAFTMGAATIPSPTNSPTSSIVRLQRHKLKRSKKPMHDPTVHLHIGPLNPPVHLTTRQSLLTSSSAALRRHLRAQVPNQADYRTRDKTMKMRNELPSTVSKFLDFIEHGIYDAGELPVREHLRLYIFAGKYEVPELSRYARRKVGSLLEGMVAEEMDVDDLNGADERREEGRGGEKAWGKVCEEVLWGVEEGERGAFREVLGRLVAPFVWQASGEW